MQQAIAQSNAIDSLRFELRAPDISDARKMDALTDLAWEYTYIVPDSVFQLAQRALHLAKNTKDSVREAIAIGTIGLYYDVSGQREKAIHHYLQSYRMQLHNQQYVNASAMLNNVGIVHFYSEDFDQAWQYFKEAMELEEAHGELYDKAGSWVNLGATAKRMAKYDEALNYTRKGVQAYLAQGDTGLYFTYVSNLGSLYLQLGEIDSALHYVSLPLAYNRRKQQLFPLGNDLQLLARIYLLEKKTDQAIAVVMESLELAEQIGNVEMALSGWELLAQAYAAKGDYALALDAKEQYITFKDSVEGVEVRKQMAALEAEFESEKKELEIERLTQENAIGEWRIQQQKKDKANLYVVVALVSLLFVLMAILYVQNQRSGKELSRKNELIEGQMQEIQELARESHHRIKNNLQSVVSILRLQSKATQSQSGKEQLEAAQKRLEAIALLHQSLYSKDRFDVMDLRSFLEQLVKRIKEGNVGEAAEVHFHLEVEAIPIQAEYALPVALIVNELITNSLKYAFTDGRSGNIFLQAHKLPQGMRLLVADDGVGFPSDFDHVKQHNFGYRLLQSLIRKMKGSLSLSNEGGARIELLFERY